MPCVSIWWQIPTREWQPPRHRHSSGTTFLSRYHSYTQLCRRYGGDPKFLSPSQPPLAPQDPSPQQYLGKALLGPDILYSDKLHGLGLFLSRLLRPLWRTPLVQLTPSGLHEPLFQEVSLVLLLALPIS